MLDVPSSPGGNPPTGNWHSFLSFHSACLGARGLVQAPGMVGAREAEARSGWGRGRSGAGREAPPERPLGEATACKEGPGEAAPEPLHKAPACRHPGTCCRYSYLGPPPGRKSCSLLSAAFLDWLLGVEKGRSEAGATAFTHQSVLVGLPPTPPQHSSPQPQTWLLPVHGTVRSDTTPNRLPEQPTLSQRSIPIWDF